jgi:hypothetical protein
LRRDIERIGRAIQLAREGAGVPHRRHRLSFDRSRRRGTCRLPRAARRSDLHRRRPEFLARRAQRVRSREPAAQDP